MNRDGQEGKFDIINMIVKGGWPATTDLPVKEAMLLSLEYIQAIINDDAYRS